ncbi:MAG: hypothetical protein JSW73_02925 [Candidatus Woesearchaeota archaeon]|nr:MAG: hypothetical protein JSW73_02925 [Candidatus Woesearchaeota archaeon]
MEPKVIRKNQIFSTKRDPMTIFPYKINPEFSAALIKLDGIHGPVMCKGEDRIYFILEGEGKFIIGNAEVNVEKEDLVFIPMKTPYDIMGTMKYLLICSPEFDPKDDVWLEDEG